MINDKFDEIYHLNYFRVLVEESKKFEKWNN